jgi:hypothetical protein
VLDFAGLRPFATERQRECLDALELHGSSRKAAAALGIHYSAVSRVVAAVKRKAALQGHSPDHDMTHVVPEGFTVKGVSTYYDAEGKPRGQWVKSRADDAAYEAARAEAVAAFVEECPAIAAPRAPLDYQTDIIPWVQIGDAHIGLLCHAAEVGENFDLSIAAAELCGAIEILIDELPACERVVINDLGDATHYENFTATTEASGHALDHDTRFPKMIGVYSRIMRWIIDKALTKAAHVDVIVNQGNHSRTNDIWMAELLRVAYGHTGRVHVLNNDSVFIGYRMGNTFVMTHHSDKCKPAKLVQVMATDFAKDWGETQFRYIDIGHIHHSMSSREHTGAVIESWNHLAATDRWAHDSGYRNRKSITTVLRSRTYGEVGRRLLPIEEIRKRVTGANVPAKKAYAV